MRRFLRSSALALALGFFLPAPGPVTGIVFNPAAYADEMGKIPDWIKSACCGPSDLHRLRPEQIEDMGDYYIVDGYHDPIRKRLPNGKPNEAILPSQDGNYWIFYSDEAAHWAGSQYGGHSYFENARQSGVYCFFLPMAL